jgi:Mu transposase, C-terminal
MLWIKQWRDRLGSAAGRLQKRPVFAAGAHELARDRVDHDLSIPDAIKCAVEEFLGIGCEFSYLMSSGHLRPGRSGRYHQNVHRGVHAIPAQLWDRSIHRAPTMLVKDPERFVIDFLPAETRQFGRNDLQINRIRYWDPLLARHFPPSTRVLIRHDPRDLSKV